MTPVVAVTTNNDSSSPSNVLVAPADALRLVVGAANNNKMGFPHRVLALLWYAEQTQSPWIRWTTNNEAFFLPSPDTARTSADFEQLLAAFFGKRLDLILRSISEWGFDVKLENAYVYLFARFYCEILAFFFETDARKSSFTYL